MLIQNSVKLKTINNQSHILVKLVVSYFKEKISKRLKLILQKNAKFLTKNICFNKLRLWRINQKYVNTKTTKFQKSKIQRNEKY